MNCLKIVPHQRAMEEIHYMKKIYIKLMKIKYLFHYLLQMLSATILQPMNIKWYTM